MSQWFRRPLEGYYVTACTQKYNRCKLVAYTFLLWLQLIKLLIFGTGSDATCGCDYEYKKVGCYEDRNGDRALPEMLANERDKHSIYYNGHDLNWFDWHNYMPQMVCRCAEQAFKKGYKYFGLQFWGK